MAKHWLDLPRLDPHHRSRRHSVRMFARHSHQRAQTELEQK